MNNSIEMERYLYPIIPKTKKKVIYMIKTAITMHKKKVTGEI